MKSGAIEYTRSYAAKRRETFYLTNESFYASLTLSFRIALGAIFRKHIPLLQPVGLLGISRDPESLERAGSRN